MPQPHLINISIHILAGSAAILLGFFLLAKAKGSSEHRRRGRLFAGLTLLVCTTATIGNVLFGYRPVFAVLTVLVLYQLLSGWRAVYTRASGPQAIDGAMTVAALAAGLLILLRLVEDDSGQRAIVVLSSLGGLATILLYDSARWLFPHRWHAVLWRYEHIYKLLASLFAMLSAAAGNLLPAGQAWTQLGPSVLGLLCIAWYWRRQYQQQRQARQTVSVPA
ncbi:MULTISPECIES: hypothetical protein [unclassified Janthinobacterium]|uniref:hypothetical protein n=1 Tax=unclassified Janthinobacterium TaxID=2610881 RepID=UPI001612D24D|nr:MULTISPECIES: hypothetical protein [unclassified Janthinobacterium]MBB5607452.1 putative membrane protein [Janthinobacterium sp. S3T4]MBB5612473.1 putative membrane protein [Janthinobacterium sp. S3M3]